MAENDTNTGRSFGGDVRAAETPAPRQRGKASRAASYSFAPQEAPGDRPIFSDAYDPTAPLSGLFAHGAADVESSHYSLGEVLERSAAAIEHAKSVMGRRAISLLALFSQRRSGEFTITVLAARLLIGLVAGFIGFRLEHRAAIAVSDAALGAPKSDILVIAEAFLMFGAIGVAAAFFGAWTVFAAGNANNGKIRRLAANIGVDAAAIAAKFDRDLGALRERMDAHGDEAVEDLSRMHLTALEAASFFHDVDFITEEDPQTASKDFREWLDANAPPAPDVSITLALFAATLGVLFGLGLGYVEWAPKPQAGPPAIVTSLLLYPWAAQAMLALGFLYAIAGVALAPLFRLITASAAAQAREDALDSIRSAFVSSKAPSVGAVIRRIEDAFAVYRARHERPPSAGGDHAHHAAQEPSWRRPPQAPRFVAPSFDAAPPSFRADGPIGAAGGKISKKRHGNTAPKQSFSSVETPPWLKD